MEREYRYCNSLNQRIASEVCNNNLMVKKCCKRTRKGCKPVHTNKISEEERVRRSDNMRALKNKLSPQQIEKRLEAAHNLYGIWPKNLPKWITET